jgi:hypothetical protein
MATLRGQSPWSEGPDPLFVHIVGTGYGPNLKSPKQAAARSARIYAPDEGGASFGGDCAQTGAT